MKPVRYLGLISSVFFIFSLIAQNAAAQTAPINDFVVIPMVSGPIFIPRKVLEGQFLTPEQQQALEDELKDLPSPIPQFERPVPVFRKD